MTSAAVPDSRSAGRPCRDRPLVIALLVLATIGGLVGSLPAWQIDALALDEHASYWIAAGNSPGTLLERSLGYSATPPLTFLLERLALDLLGKHAWALRLPSLLGMWLAPVFVFLAGRRMQNSFVAVLAAVAMAWHPDLWEPCRMARTYGVTVALSSAALYATVRLQDAPRSWAWTLIWTILLTALLWNHYVNVVFVTILAVLTLAFLCHPLRGGISRAQILVAVLGLTACSLPLVPPFIRNWEFRPFLEFVRVMIPPWRQAGLLTTAMLPLSVGCAALHFRQLRFPGTRYDWLLVLFAAGLGLKLLFFLLSVTVSPTLGHSRYALAGTPAVVLLLTSLIGLVPRPIAMVLTCAAIACGWIAGGTPIWVSREIDSPSNRDWKSIGLLVEREGKTGEPIFVFGGLVEATLIPMLGNDPLFEEYIASRLGRFHVTTPHRRVGLPLLWTQLPDCQPIYDAVLSNAVEKGRKVWVANATDVDLGQDTGTAMRAFLMSRGWKTDLVREETTARLERFVAPGD